jgi:DNA-directed RNA polymerase subunit L
MEINYLEEGQNKIKVEIKGEGHTLCNPLVKELWQDKSVEVAGYHIDHSLVSNPILIVESSSDAKTALKKAIDRVSKKIKEMDDKFKKVKL